MPSDIVYIRNSSVFLHVNTFQPPLSIRLILIVNYLFTTNTKQRLEINSSVVKLYNHK